MTWREQNPAGGCEGVSVQLTTTWSGQLIERIQDTELHKEVPELIGPTARMKQECTHDYLSTKGKRRRKRIERADKDKK